MSEEIPDPGYAKSVVEEFINQYGKVSHISRNHKSKGKDLIALEDHTVIRLPADFSRVSKEEFEEIASVKLDVHSHELEYWLNERNKINQ